MAANKESVAIRIPGYVIEREIGRGAVATVYLAVQQSLDRKVALKVMSPALAAEPDFSVRFEREGRIVAGFSHPNIVTIYDVGVFKYQHYIAMEYLGSGSLKRQLAVQLETQRGLKIIKEMAAALGYAHEHGYVHRDVKPENILFKSNGVAVLTDFGIAKSSTSNTQLTRSGTIVGTPRYMSPEQAHGSAATPQSDIYALGIILFEMLAGRPPFDTAESVAVLYAHINDPIPALPENVAALQPLVDAMMAKDPSNRVPDCGTLGDLAIMVEREIESPTGSSRRIWRPVTSIEQQRREQAGLTDGSGTEATFQGRPVDTGEVERPAHDAGVGGNAMPGTASSKRANPAVSRSRKRTALIGGGAVVSAAALAGVVLALNGTLTQWIRPPATVPLPVAETSQPKPVTDTITDQEVVLNTESRDQSASLPADLEEQLTAIRQNDKTGMAERSISDASGVTDSDSGFSDIALGEVFNNVDALVVVSPETGIEDNSEASVAPEGPFATGVAVDPASVSGTRLAPPAPIETDKDKSEGDTPTVTVENAQAASIEPTQVTEEAPADNVNTLANEDAVTTTLTLKTTPVVVQNDGAVGVNEADVAEVASDGAEGAEPQSELDVASVQNDSIDTPLAETSNEPDVSSEQDENRSILPPSNDEPTPNTEELVAAALLSEQDISTLLNVAIGLVSEDKLAHPPEENAVDIYQQVLAAEPDNIDAISGLEDIAGVYFVAAREKVNEEDLALAALEIERGLKARPDDPALIELQSEVRDMIEANAAFQEAENYFFGLDGPIDLERSCDRYLEAAEKGHGQAALGLAICYANGFGFEQSEEEALTWMKFAAETEEPEALYNLALGLLFGDNPNPEFAANYIRQAADLGYERAYRVLGWMHQTGTGVEQSTRDAIKWGFRGAINERSEGQASTRKVVERWESVFQNAYDEAQAPDEDKDDSSS